MDLDMGVTATNNDATICKYQAVRRRYYKDPFLEHFVNQNILCSSNNKPPEINRGYYLRTAAITYIVEQFVAHHSEFCQIISLGAGYDSLYWRLKSHDLVDNCTYVEIDMSLVVQRKISAIMRKQALSKSLTNITKKNESLHSDKYHLLSLDLRQFCKDSTMRELTEECHISQDLPTLFIAECVLVYMPLPDSDALIKFLSLNFSNMSFLNYEQCNMKDVFGKIMMDNMITRNCDLMGVEACNSLASQIFRFTTNNLNHTKAWTMMEIYSKLISRIEIERIEQLEFFDERELLDQLLEHYCVIVASNQMIDWIPNDQYWQHKSMS